MLSAAHDILINGGTFINHEGSPGKTGLQLLHTYTAPGATHDSAERFPPPRCHPKTRREIVQRIVKWTTDSTKEERVLWLNGPVGAGKSAIAQTLAEFFLSPRNANASTDEDITLAASFFFSRTAQRRNTEQFLFLTLAYQIGIVFPEAGEMIGRTIEEDSSVMQKSLEVQFQRLVVGPLQRSLRGTGTGRTGPVVIIIDGLDECSGEDMQRLILRLIGSIFDSDLGHDRQAQAKFPICFIIASRPEPWIRDEFSTGTLAKVVKEVSLAEALQVDEDIRTFYRSAFVDICDSPKHRRTMANTPRPWPTDAIIELLVEKASGQFQYASTVIKFVDDPQHRPIDRLDAILRLNTPCSNNDNPFAELDGLYTQILSTCVDRERTCKVLGTLFAMSTAASNLRLKWTPSLEMLEVVEQLLELKAGDADLALRTIHSLVYVRDSTSGLGSIPPKDSAEQLSREPQFRVHHKSSLEFFFDRARSGEYFIDMEAINGQLALRCLDILTQGPHTSSDAPGVEYVTWGYALLHWTDHCVCSRLTPQLLQALAGFNLCSKYVITLKPMLTNKEMDSIKQLERQRTTSYLFRLFQAIDTSVLANPNPSDEDDDRFSRARDFMVSHGAQIDMTLWRYGFRVGLVADWVSWETGQFPLTGGKGSSLVTGYRAVAEILKKAHDKHGLLKRLPSLEL